MTPEEQAKKRLEAAKAQRRSLLSGAPAAEAAPAAPSGVRRASTTRPSVIEDDTPDGASFLDYLGLSFALTPSNLIGTAIEAAGNAAFTDDSFTKSAISATKKRSAFALGGADSVTLGFSDEIAAGAQALAMGGSYSSRLRQQRASLKRAEEEEYSSFLAGQLVGGLLPTSRISQVAGLGRAGVGNLGRSVFEAGAVGAAYGFGSAESEDLLSEERFQNAATYGLFGAAGGFVIGTAILQGSRVAKAGYSRLVNIRQGASPRIDYKFNPIQREVPAVADDAAEGINDLRSTLPRERSASTPQQTPAGKAAKAVNRITGKPLDEVEQGAIASADDMLGKTPKADLINKLAGLTPQQAKVMGQKLMDAMESGDLATEPHYRSIMGLDLSQFGELEKVIPEVADILFELGEGILQKSSLGSTTVKSYEAQLRARYGSNITEGELDALVEKVLEVRGNATVGKIQMTLAGVQFARSAQDLMPRVMAGEREAKTILAEELSKALRVSARAQLLLSEAGRNLGMLSNSKSMLMKDLPDGSQQLEDLTALTKKVNESLEKMDNDALNELLASTRDLSKLDEIQKILLDPVHAEKVNLYFRTRNTATAILKSTVLTATSLAVNLVGVPIHNWIRNDGARALAAAAARASGDEASALVLQAQRQAAAAVRWEATKLGTVAFFRRIKWEALGSTRDILGVAGASKAAQRASTSRQAMIAAGYRPPQIREYDLNKRLAVTDIAGFNKKLSERLDSGMPFASLANFLERSGAVALNTFDALGTASAKIVSGGADDAGRAWIMARETYAEMAGFAAQRALKEGLTGDAFAKRVQDLAEEWTKLPPKEILERVEQKILSGDGLDDEAQMLLRRDYNAEREADKVLFMDGPQTRVGQVAAKAAEVVDEMAAFVTSAGILKGALIPYIATPTRIIERGLVSYTPWGKFTKEAGDILRRAELPTATADDKLAASMERARMDIGGVIISAGMVAAATGAITITNGADYQNTANLDGVPSLRVNLPNGGYAEFGRLDPIAMGMAMGGVIGQMWKAAQESGDQYGQDDAIATAAAVAYGGIRDAILNKSYLQGLNKFFEALTSTEENAKWNYFTTFHADAAARFVPFSGMTRQINEMIAGRATEAVGALDKIAKVVPGMGAYLPARVDALGNEIESNAFGLKIGTRSDDDAITQQMRDLGIDINNLAKADPLGFSLTSEELSELRKIRGTEAYNSDGLTMREALANLFSDPAFQNLPDKAMVQDEVVAVMKGFNEPAREIFEQRNQGYLADREAARSFKLYMSEGLMSAVEARKLATEDTEAQGLTPTRSDSLE